MDDTFIAATSGYCEENRSNLKIEKADGNSLKVDFPSPNAFTEKTTTNTDTSVVTTASYFNDITLNGKKLRLKNVFKLEVPNRLKDYLIDFEFHLTEMELDGKSVKVTTQESAAASQVTIARKDNGAWELKD